jgi:hypothetical protein
MLFVWIIGIEGSVVQTLQRNWTREAMYNKPVLVSTNNIVCNFLGTQSLPNGRIFNLRWYVIVRILILRRKTYPGYYSTLVVA